jgi:hypothetical protein
VSPSVHTGSDQGTDQGLHGRDGSPEARLSTRHLTSKQPTEVDILTRGLVAIAWAAVFVAVSDSVTSGVTVGGGVPVVLYPLIDVGASLIDARDQHGSARQRLPTLT